MILKNEKGEEKDVFLETLKLSSYREILRMGISEPTKEQIQRLKKEKCRHQEQNEFLVFDELGFPYDLRFCFVCGRQIGTV